MQFSFFRDDSIEVLFKDYSLIELSPCGANYQYCRPLPGHPGLVDCHSAIKQRCVFATSETKSKVRAALKLRNLFATRPYLPSKFSNLSDNAVIHLYKDITSFYWDSCCDKENVESVSCSESGGRVTVTSKQEHAQLSMDLSGQNVIVHFLARLSPCRTSFSSVQKDQVTTSLGNEKVPTAAGSRRQYVWLKQVFPVGFSPACWKYPLALALQKHSESEVDPRKSIPMSHCPRTLPSVCANQHKHQWTSAKIAFGQQSDAGTTLPVQLEAKHTGKVLKVLWDNSTVYWLGNVNTPSAEPKVEVWLVDGSVLQSISVPKQYFRHVKRHPETSEIELDRTYFPTALPMQATLKAAALRAMRLLSYLEECKHFSCSSQTCNACWQDELDCIEMTARIEASEEAKCSNAISLNETAVLPGLGKFSAVNGNIQIRFDDGTTLYAIATSANLACCFYEKPLVTCRVLLTDGSYGVSEDMFLEDSALARYTKPACDWLEWLSQSPAERAEHPFYSDTIFAPDKLDMVTSELEKICRFNVLADLSSSSSRSFSTSPQLDSSASSDFNHRAPESHMSDSISSTAAERPLTANDVVKALRDTNRAISDIESVLQVCRQ